MMWGLTWQDWLLCYLLGGFVFVLSRAASESDLRDARDTLLSVLVYAIAPFTYAWYRYDKAKRERMRQAHITTMVDQGTYTEEATRKYLGWKGRK